MNENLFTIAHEHQMTAEQVAAMREFRDSIKAETILVGQQLVRARSLRVPLPATSHTGVPVVHGANLQANALASYWTGRLNLVLRFLREEQVNQIFAEAGIDLLV